MINTILILIALACLLWMAREINVLRLEERARRQAKESMDRALEVKYFAGHSREELERMSAERWSGD
jgi:hypothetical protein